MGTWHFYDSPRYYRHTGPLLVEFVAGPGTGKSTTATGLFSLLKQAGRNVEYVPEVAKDLTWEGRTVALSCQPYIAAKQLLHFDRLKGKVDAIITDTSTLLGLHHGDEEHGATPEFRDWLLDDHDRRRTLTIFLRRDPERPYNTEGRSESEDEARAIDAALLGLLERHKIDHFEQRVHADNSHIATLAEVVTHRAWGG